MAKKTKQCPKCEYLQPIGEFSKDKTNSDGLQAYCKECNKQYGREYYERNRNGILRQSKKWGKKYRRTIRGQEVHRKASKKYSQSERRRKTWLKYKYDITPEQHEQMYLAQDGRCAICPEAVPYGEICVDHDHITGRVRGLLCRKCNFMLGMANDDPKVLESAAKYMRGNK